MSGFSQLLVALFTLGATLLFGVLPFAICGWAFGKLRSYWPAVWMFLAIGFFWTFMMVLGESSMTERYWGWSLMVVIFAVSAAMGWLYRKHQNSNLGRRHVNG